MVTSTIKHKAPSCRTRKDQATLRDVGDIRGFFGKLPQGRPPKRKVAPPDAQSEIDTKKTDQAEKKKAEKEAREKKKSQASEDEKGKKARLHPELKDEVDKGLEHVLSLSKARLSDILKYFFDDQTKKVYQMKVSELKELIRTKYMIEEA